MKNENLFEDKKSGEFSLKGVVEKILFQNPENGYTVAKIKDTETREIHTITGNLPSLNIGESIKLRGEWTVHKKFGPQIEIIDYESITPMSTDGIEKFLGSGLIKYIGPKTAEAIVSHFGKDTLEIIDKKPKRLLEVDKIGKVKLEQISKGWDEYKSLKDIIIFLQSHNIGISFALKIFDRYGLNSIEVVNSNPYQLIYDIKGIGFKSADSIAEKLGEERDSINRVKAALVYLLDSASEEGHVFLPKNILLENAEELLSINPEKLEEGINELLKDKRIIIENDNVFLISHYEAETYIANKIQRILSVPFKKIDTAVLDGEIPNIELKMGIKFAVKQKEAIKKAVNNKIFILTGGPGTGKTTIINGIIELFRKMKLKVTLCAPTGRAAKRMEETCGIPAKTIHRLLVYTPRSGEFSRDESNPIPEDVVIVDESSMMDVFIFKSLLKGISLDTRLILVGDDDQLPSVGPGNVLKDLLSSDKIELTHLDEVFRQESMNSIILNAHRINSGDKIHIDNKNDENFFFIYEESPEMIVERIKELCKVRLPGKYGCDPLNDIQILTPMHKGEIGAINLNNVLQESLNTRRAGIKRGNSLYKVGDKVLQTRNNYDKDIYNGDIGIIKAVDLEESRLLIGFESKEIVYEFKELDEITLAYAITVHKSQGSEYDYVIIPFTTQHYIMLQRNLLYTAVTRAKKVIIMIGTYKALNIAINNNKVSQRYTSLKERIRECLS
ncbi:ATP-dependent RecD-like DNA helicase [candidate division KSB1 bacterium]